MAEVFGGLPHRERDAGLDERRVDMLADASAITVVEGRQDRRQCEQRGAEIGQRHAHLDRRPAWLAGHRHQSGDPLGDEIEAAFGGVRPGLSVARDRGIDQRRTILCQRRVIEAEPAHDSRSIVLDEDIGGGDEAPHDVLAARGGEIQHDAALAAIEGIEAGALGA